MALNSRKRQLLCVSLDRLDRIGILGCEGEEAVAQGAQRSCGAPGFLAVPKTRLDRAWSNLR